MVMPENLTGTGWQTKFVQGGLGQTTIAHQETRVITREETDRGNTEIDSWDKQSSTSTATTYIGCVEYQHVEHAKPCDAPAQNASVTSTTTQVCTPGAAFSAAIRPPNFHIVMPGVYRSSFPRAENYGFVLGMRIKTVVTLVQKEKFPQDYESFLQTNTIQHRVFDIKGTKKEAIPPETMRAILSVVLDTKNYPVLIHCNHGKHRTGCVVGIVRRLAGWDLASILGEYEAHAAPKARACDVEYISGFDLAELVPPAHREAPGPARTTAAASGSGSGSGSGFLRSGLVVIAVALVWIVAGAKRVASRFGSSRAKRRGVVEGAQSEK